jgi:hypothetical protein
MPIENTYGPFHRLGDPSDVIDKIAATRELYGRAPRNYFRSDRPKVKAYRGLLPSGHKGFEFETKIRPDTGCPPDQAYWSNGRPGVTIEGDCAKINVTVTKIVK